MRIDQLKEAVAQDEVGAVIVIEDPNGVPYTAADGSEVTMTVVGSQSRARRKAEDAAVQVLQRSGRAGLHPDAARARRLNLVASCVIDMHGWEDEAGQPIPFNAANVKAIFAADDRITAQVESAIERHDFFLAKNGQS